MTRAQGFAAEKGRTLSLQHYPVGQHLCRGRRFPHLHPVKVTLAPPK